MNHKKWVKVWFLTGSFIGSVAAFNYIIDPYGLNEFAQIKHLNSQKLPNTSITTRVKTHIIQKGGFDTLMLGTSRIGVIDPYIVNMQLNAHALNLEYPASITPIQNKLFFYALKFNNIKNVIYAIDFFSFNKSRTIQGDFREFSDFQEDIESKNNIYNFDMYFNLKTFFKSIRVIKMSNQNITPYDSIYHMDNGMRDYINHIAQYSNGTYDLDNNIQKSIEHYFVKGAGEYQNYQFSYDYLNSFKEVVQYCEDNGIHLWVYISPMYADHYDAIYERGYAKEFELFKHEIGQITSYTDLSGHTKLTEEKNNYWDSSHVRKELSEIIVKEVLREESSDQNISIKHHL